MCPRRQDQRHGSCQPVNKEKRRSSCSSQFAARTSRSRTSSRGWIRGPVSWSCRSGPHVLLSAGREPSPLLCRSAVCCSAATASPPVRATEHQSTASQGRAGGRVEKWGRACLGLDRCATLGQPHGGSVGKRGSKA